MMCRTLPYEGKEPYIFLSYCHQNRNRLARIFEQLVLDGCRIWFDDGNHAGDDWLDNIESHLDGCRVCIAFISKESSLSHNCKGEITYALRSGIKVVPVLIDSADLPKGMRMQLSHLHYLKASDFSSDRALLSRIYESEGFAACRAEPGSLKLADMPQDAPPVKRTGFFKDLHAVTPVPELPRQPEPEPLPRVPEKKAVKVRLSAAVKRKQPALPEPPEEPVPQPPVAKPSIPVPRPAPEHYEDADIPYGEATELAVWEEEPAAPVLREDQTVYMQEDSDATLRSTGQDPKEDSDDVTQRSVSRTLAYLLHPAAQRAYPLTKPQIRLGRSPLKCDIVIDGNESISKHHADIIQYNQKCFLRDANSANGTFFQGQPLEADQQMPLENPAVFQLSDETLVLVSGMAARRLSARKSCALLLNDHNTAACIMEADVLPLNRGSKWPDGTLSDPRVHRAAHALLRQEADGVYLVDESPERGNGTYLNGIRLKHGESRLLSTGDRIRLGETSLSFVSITL